MTDHNKMAEVRPAQRYVPPRDLWVVSAFFDSEGYSSKRRALRSYLRTMEISGIRLMIVEGAFGNAPFLLQESDRVLHVRCSSVMWQKERLLNVAIQNLPASCRKVAWLDTDVFFENPRWAVETAALLDEVPVVQPYDVALWLPKGTTRFRGRGIATSGFAATAHTHPGLFLSGDFDRHGHTGYAWAARREILEDHGLYDRSVVGSGDHLMAHAMVGDLASPCVTNSVGVATSFRDSFHAWAKPFHRKVRSRIGFVPGAVLHRWHGDRKKRRYYKRMVGLLARKYDPVRDVAVSPSGALEWTNHGAALGRWMKDYFAQRQEDGRPGHVDRIDGDFLKSLRYDRSSPLDDNVRSIAPLLGPLATVVSEQRAAWTRAGLTPVLPNLVASILLSALPSSGADDGSDTRSKLILVGATGRRLTDGGPALFSSIVPAVERLARGPASQIPDTHRGNRGVVWSTKEARRGDDPFDAASRFLDAVLQEAKESERRASRLWRQMPVEGKWAALSGVSEDVHGHLTGELNVRIRDPRWDDAPELRAATKQLLKRRARLAARSGLASNPYDAVVGPGSSAAGLEHV